MWTLFIVLGLMALLTAPRFADDADPEPDFIDPEDDGTGDAEDAPEGEGDEPPAGEEPGEEPEGDDDLIEIDDEGESDKTKASDDAFAAIADPTVKAEAQRLYSDLQSLSPLEQAQVYSLAIQSIRQQQGQTKNGKKQQTDPDAGKKAQAAKAAQKAKEEGVAALSDEDREILKWAKQERARRQQEEQQSQTKRQREQFQTTLKGVLDEVRVSDEGRRQELIDQFTGHVTFNGAENNVAAQFRRWLKGKRRGPSPSYIRKKRDDAARTRGEGGGSRTASKKVEEFSVDDFEKGDFSKLIDALS